MKAVEKAMKTTQLDDVNEDEREGEIAYDSIMDDTIGEEEEDDDEEVDDLL